jgi:tetratricopeptide (TPR) repeat protein
MTLRYIHILLLFSGIALFSCKSTSTSTSAGKKQVDVVPADNSALFIDASKEKALGNYHEAIRLYQKCLEVNPRDGASMFELSKLYTLQGNAEQALNFAKQAVEVEGNNIYYLLFYAGLLQSTEDYEAAAKLYEKVIEIKPNYPEYYDRLAMAYIYAGKPMEAVKIYDQLEEKAGITEEYSMKKQSIYVQENKITKAIEELEKLISAYPLETKYYAVLAELCMNHGYEERALQAYEKIAELDEDDPYIHISLADYYKKQGDLAKSFEELKLGFYNPNLDIDSKIQILIRYYTVNEIYSELKAEAFELAEILLEVHPNDPKSYSMYGDFLYQDGRFEEARDAFRHVIELDSSKYLVWEQLLFTESELRDNNAIYSESIRAIELFPEQPIPYLFAGGALYEQKKWDECIRILEQGAYYVVNNDRLLAQFYAYLGDAYNQVDETEKSDAAYDKVLTIDPNHDYVLNNYAYYLSLRGENLEKAAKMAKRATELQPSSSNQDTYGWVLYKMGYYEEAKLWIEKAIENGAQDNPVILEHLGDVYWQLGNQAKAIELWNKAKESGEGSELLEKKVKDKTLYE